MTDIPPDRPHPLGLTDNPEWEVSLTRRAELYLAERARRAEREPTGGGAFIAVVAGTAVFVSIGGYLFELLFG